MKEIQYEDFKIESPFREFSRKFLKKKSAVISLAFLVFLLILVVFQPTPYDISAIDYDNILCEPNSDHLFGTDEYGRDVLSRIITGTRISLSVAIIAVTIGAIIGSILGIIAGYYGGLLESLIMRSCDVLFSFPGLLLAIGIVAIIGPGLTNVVIAISIYGIPTFTRIIRSSTLSIKELLYIEASKSIGVSDMRLLFKHIFPGTLPSLIVSYTMRMGTAIISAASLSFLGFGASPKNPDWGAMLSTGRDYIGVAPHMLFYPGLMIFLTVLAFNLLGDGLRDTLDPKLD
ncbi:glutathione transport system permease protein [Sedimentibacter acidaminivorans]|uniref:Glutathione transport system permease protein GsiD n=1 Tax=Sedimentibacter acidaminivorans TaxID=913099 RepID=A0ABS4GAY7_9FIRM|nr:ABC transporter permease subunit [Sedimentibacter acidaminivorans]MBP1924844.1 glutathione transport system permease protein [Sedimentibacter acidaminivorans]